MISGSFRSEWTKFFSYHWCLLGAAVTLFLAPIVLIFSQISLTEVLQFMYLSQTGIVVFSAAFCGQEYLNGSLRTTFLAVPSRKKVLFSKFLVLMMLTLVIGLLSSLLCLAVATLKLPLHQLEVVSFYQQFSLAMVSWVQIAWLTAGITFLTKSFIVPIATLFTLIIGGSQMLFGITSLAKYLPDLAAINLFMGNTGRQFLGNAQGLLVQFIWLLLFVIVGSFCLLRRDVR